MKQLCYEDGKMHCKVPTDYQLSAGFPGVNLGIVVGEDPTLYVILSMWAVIWTVNFQLGY